MRILVFDVPASSGGALSVLKDFFNYLNNSDTPYEWIFVVSTQALQEEKSNIKVLIKKFPKLSWMNRIIWELFFANRLVKKIKPDVILSLQNTSILFTSIPQVIYVHQSIPFFHEKKWSYFKKEERVAAVYRDLFGVLIGKSVKNAKAIIVQTQWMKKAVAEKYSCSLGKISVIPPSIHHGDEYCRADGSVERNKFFYPCSPYIYKNIMLIVNTVRKLLKKGYNPIVYLTMRGDESRHAALILDSIVDIKDNIKMIGFLPREKIMEMYKTYTLLFASYLETFGLPLLEARLCGTPIIAADRPFSREILEGYENVAFFNAFSEEDLAGKMAGYMSNSLLYPLNLVSTSNNQAFVSAFSGSDTWGRLVHLLEQEIVSPAEK